MNRSNVIVPVVMVVSLAVAGQVCGDPKPDIFGYEAWQQAIEQLDVDPAQVVYPFQVTEEMKAWAAEKLHGYQSQSPQIKLAILQRAFFDPGEFEFEYDVVRTFTAEEAFEARRGNCMSFTSLFIALSRSQDMNTFLMSVKRQPEVIRDGGLVVVNRHVVAGYMTPSKIHIFDFYVTDSSPYITQSVLDDLEASAIYHTNIGGSAIREGDLEEAVRNLDIAVALAPRWAPAWINLAVSYTRLGNFGEAFIALDRALEIEPGNSSALVNLAKIYKEQGREEEAETAMRAAAESTRNPFTLIAMADVEMTRGELGQARQYLRRARWWYGKEPEVYNALARLEHLEGDDEKAAKHLRRAAELIAERQREAEALDD